MTQIFSFASYGYEGILVRVEIDIRTGIPGMEIVGLPDIAVRESRERIRVALRRGGFSFPKGRVLVNLSPAGFRKEGASFDLPIALALLSSSHQIPESEHSILVMGELLLSGSFVGPGGSGAVASGLEAGVGSFSSLRKTGKRRAPWSPG
jgi:magnesium chelatase family protein